MIKLILTASLFLTVIDLSGQVFNQQTELHSLDYGTAKSRIVEKLKNIKPGKFGEFIPGLKQKIPTQSKTIALTFDACGGPTGSDYDAELIKFLKEENLPATLFVSGSWIEKNLSNFKQLCQEPLFEIENHGLTHRPLTIAGESKYGIKGSESLSAAYDDIQLNAKQIEFYAHKKSKFYRPGTATADEAGVALAREMKTTLVSYSVLSNDALARSSAEFIKSSILKKIEPGAIVIMHMNHPKRNGLEALRLVIPILRNQGYQFVKLQGNLQ